MKLNFNYEIELANRGYRLIAGVDEVGRGALAGPIVAAAVVFNPQKSFYGIRRISDSKELGKDQRSVIRGYILNNCLDFGIGAVDNIEIDKYGIGSANILAFKRSLDNLKEVDFALIDGRRFRGFDYNYKCIIGGDALSLSIAAASILAKTYRDEEMEKNHQIFPKYNFKSHKGYGTKKHIEAIINYGICKIHRKSFLGKIKNSQNLDI